MGDPRMAYYIQVAQDANGYPENYSPNRRNIRWTTIYQPDSASKPKVYGRVMPSEWPDGGHNSYCYDFGFSTSNDNIYPDDLIFMSANATELADPDPKNAVMPISNVGYFYSATELGRIYDPIMWTVAQPPTANAAWGDVSAGTDSCGFNGGGNTLRIGRPEHQQFDQDGLRASQLLDLFHAGVSTSLKEEERDGPVTEVEGNININTASEQALQALIYGKLLADPKISHRLTEKHILLDGSFAPPTRPYEMEPQEISDISSKVSKAILTSRKTSPFASTSELATVKDTSTKAIFGNTSLFKKPNTLEATDAVLEETFARIYNTSTVRSRNFRVWVVAQSLAPTTENNTDPTVLAEVRKCFDVFADPGERNDDGTINKANSKLTILDTYDF